MDKPFANQIQLVELPDQPGPARMQVLENRDSTSRRLTVRGQRVVTIGFTTSVKPNVIPTMQVRMGLN